MIFHFVLDFKQPKLMFVEFYKVTFPVGKCTEGQEHEGFAIARYHRPGYYRDIYLVIFPSYFLFSHTISF